jgi:hypothetical protein
VANERWDYIALQDILDPGYGRAAYREGEGLYAQVVEDWGLVVGEDVTPARPDSMPQPAGNASRAQWAKYAQIQGVDPDEVDGMTRDQLRDKFAAEPDPDPDTAQAEKEASE